jgi:hypothetical protein
MWCHLIHDKYVKLILNGQKTWEIRTQKLFNQGERIALGNTGTKLVEGYATVSEVKKMTVPEMMRHNEKHFANDFILQRWSDREWLYAFVLSEVTVNPFGVPYPHSYGSPKVRLKTEPFVNA